MNRDRTDPPRARYDVPSTGRSTGSTGSRDTLPQMPRSIGAAPTSVQVAWIMASTQAMPTGEVNEEAFRAIEVSLEDAYLWGDKSEYEVRFGPTYSGRSLLEALPVAHPAVLAACTVLRAERYEQVLQEQAPELQRQIDLAYQAASDEAYATIAPQMEAWEAAMKQLMNNARYVGRHNVPRPEPPEADLAQARKIEKQVARLGEEIQACRRRRQVALATVSGTLGPLSEALAQLLWLGPSGDPYHPDWHPMYEAHERLREILDPIKADEVWARAEQRWGRG